MLGEASQSQHPQTSRFTWIGHQQEGSVHGRLRSDWTAGSRIHWKLLEMAGPALSSAEVQGTPGAQESLWG